MVDMIETVISERWSILLPEHRANRIDDNGVNMWSHWEKERIAAMHDVVQEGDIVFDIGTEEGDISALLATWAGASGNVCLFEPNPRVWPNIRAIWEANGLPIPQDYWVGFAANVDDFNPPNLNIDATPRDGWPECAYGPLIGDHGFRHLAEEFDATPRIKLDTFATNNNLYPNVITMDVEGAEFEVLKGAEQILTEYSPIVFVSVHPEFIQEMYDCTPEDILDWMYNLGYGNELLAIDHEHHYRFAK